MSGNLLCWFCLCHPHAANRRRCAERSIWNLEGFFFFLFHYVFFWQIVFYIQRDRDKTSFSQITWHIRKKKLQKNRKRCIFIQFMEYVITCVINALAVPAKILFFLLPWPMKKKNKKTHKHLYSFYFVVAKFRMFFLNKNTGEAKRLALIPRNGKERQSNV